MEGRKSEDEKNEAALACDVFESSNAKLPKNVFRSSFTWSCYEFINSSPFHIGLLLCLTLIVGWKFFSARGGKRPSDSNMDGPQTKHKRNPGFLRRHSIIVIFVISLTQSFSRKAFEMYRARTFGKQITQFAKEIIKSEPSTDMESWDRVAADFNSYIILFFDGSSCHVAFRRTLLWISSRIDGDYKIEYFRKHPYIEEALKVYFAEVDRKWNLITSQQLLSNISVGNIKLPGQSCRFKLFHIFKKVMKQRFSQVATVIFFVMSIRSPRNLGFFFTLALFVVLVCSQEWFLFEFNRSCSMELEHKMRFLSTIISEHQKSDVNCWDQIAKKMNVYLREQKVFDSDAFFLDGADCERFFERDFLRNLPSRKSSHLGLPIAELLPYIKKADIACSGKQLI
ncbi:BAQ_1a_G0025560.mRNA.1.CDS.1 [Saccharomyces cerevisiae]|nr:BAQ_1a_G0025560.mRNA.1.CDS.1 [Saccharomyces cerevisiae]CAI7087785.1 BAQ_1a_G0025560.mRNA.1.CDS.1 [Saccharomyces cerevisiae]